VMVRETFPLVQIIETGDNLGFARATNVGIRATASDLVLLLNPDTEVPAGAIQHLVRALDAAPAAAAMGPRLTDAGGRSELSFGWAISPLGELRQKLVGALFERRVGAITRRVEQWTRTSGEREWISGACLLARRYDLEAVGLLDERYFMYLEDVDFCAALRARGRRILFTPDVTITHLRGRSRRAAPAATARAYRDSQRAFYAKHHPWWAPLLHAYLRLKGA
jgi:N-acetylglucosaminyl-diphospho-decaprenol L-rhamnosyltransferase